MLEAEYLRLEPAKNLANTSKNRAFDPAFTEMLRG